MTDVQIIADDDVDGLCAARIIYIYETRQGKKCHIDFLKWDEFGLYSALLYHKFVDASTYYFLDIGSDLHTLYSAAFRALYEHAQKIVIIDNHSPTFGTPEWQAWHQEAQQLQQRMPKLTIYSTTQNCSAGLAWHYVWEQDASGTPFWADIWALIGAEGDAALDKFLASTQADTNRPRVDMSRTLAFFQATPLLGTSGTSSYTVLARLAHLFHTVRRVLWDESMPLLWDMMHWIDKDGWDASWDELMYIIRRVLEIDAQTYGFGARTSKPQMTVPPSVEKILEVYRQWPQWEKRFEEAYHFIIKIAHQPLGISIVSHPWNVGSAVSYRKGKDALRDVHQLPSGAYAPDRPSAFNIPWICINRFPKSRIHISGRLGSRHSISIGQLFERTAQIWKKDYAAMVGPMIAGGLDEAGSGIIYLEKERASDTDIVHLIGALVEAAEAIINQKPVPGEQNTE